MIGVERVDYIRVPVTDIDEAKHFYGDVLGLEENPNSPGGDWIEFETGNVTLAVMTPHTHDYEFAPLLPATLALRVPGGERERERPGVHARPGHARRVRPVEHRTAVRAVAGRVRDPRPRCRGRARR